MEGVKETMPAQANDDFNTSVQARISQPLDLVKTVDLKGEISDDTRCSDLTDSSNTDGMYSEDNKKCTSSFSNDTHEKGQEDYLEFKIEITNDSSSRIEDDILTLFPFVCGICEEKFNSLAPYFTHIAAHENVDTFLHCCNQFNDRDDTESSLFSCGICNVKYPTLCMLYEHLLEVEAVSDFVYRDKDRTVYAYCETSVDSSVNSCQMRKNEQSKSSLTSGKSLDSNNGNSCNESDTIVKEKQLYLKRTDSENKNMLIASRNTKKRQKVKTQAIERDAKKIPEYETKKLRKQKCERSHYPGRKSKTKLPQLAHEGNIKEKVSDTDNSRSKKQKKDSHRKKEVETEVKTVSETDPHTSSLQGKEDNIIVIDDSADESDISVEPVKKKSSLVEKILERRRNRSAQLCPCEICGAIFKHCYLSKHRQTHEKQTLACGQCGKIYCSKFVLEAHKRQVHTEEMKYICDVCGKRFKAHPYLRQHRQVHIIEKNIQCPVCPMKFKYKAVLRAHMKTHSDEKPYICELCGAKFRRAGTLTIHKKSHRDEKTFSCPECSKLFKSKSDMKKHFQIHLPPKVFCTVCGKGFVYKANMRVHMKTHGIFS